MTHIASLLLGLALAGTTDAPRQGVPDAFEDTFGGFLDQPDVSRVTAWYTSEALIVEVRFHAPITPPDFELGLGLVGSIEIDADRDPLTGVTSFMNVCPTPRETGFEVFVTLFGFEPDAGNAWRGTAPLLDIGFDTIGQAVVTYAPSRATIEVPLALIPGGSGEVDVAIALGTPGEPTDCAPDLGNASAFGRVFADGLES